MGADKVMPITERSQFPLWRIFGFSMAVALVLAASGVLFYRHERLRIQTARYEAIKAIASLKVTQIVTWRDEQQGYAQRNTRSPFLMAAVRDLLHGEDADLRARLQDYLQMIRQYQKYQDVILTTVDSRLLLSASAEEIAGSDHGNMELVEKALAAGQPVFGDFIWCQTCKRTHLDVAVPVLDQAGRPLAVLIQRSDPQAYLYPLLHSWPMPSPSAETLLVRRDGAAVLILSPHQHQSDMALSQRIPLTQTQMPVVQAALGTTGLFEGLDYRGLPVVADLQIVPGTPWALVAKVDKAEILAEAREHGWFIGGLVALGTLLAGSLAAFSANFSQRKIYHSLLLAEQEQRQTDVTLQETAARLQKLNRIYIVLNAVNQAIVRERDPQVLFSEACRIAVEKGAFRMAWVGLLDESAMTIRPVAQAGASDGYVEQLGLVLDDSPSGQGPTATAFRTGQPVVVNDIATDPRMAPWRESALGHGYRASAAFPLTVQGRVAASFNLYSAEPGFFDEAERQLLDEMARDLAFALEFTEQEQKRLVAEENVRHATRQWQSSFAAISDALCILDKDCVIVNANQTMARLCQMSVEEMSGRQCWEVVHSTAQPIAECPVAKMKQTRMRASAEILVKGKTFEVLVDPIQAEDGAISGVVHIMRDITERIQADDDRRRLSQAMEQSPASLVITDPRGVIEYVNPKLLAMTGYTLEEVLGKKPNIFKSGETDQAEYRRLWQSILEGGEWHGEFHNRKKDGTLFWERASISAIRNAAGEIINFLAVKEDISQQKILEEQLAQSQKLETVGRLAGGVAHDFNNMLGVILGCAELALDQVAVGDPIRLDLEEICKAAQRSASLTRQLLAFARKQVATPQVLNLNETIDGMLKMLKRLLGENITLEWRPGADLWPVKIDPSQLDQILANLAVNARDALDRNGIMTIETANVALDETYCKTNLEFRPGEYVVLMVSDTGTGMDQATLAHIFEPFFTTKALGSGTGLGLATTYGVVKQNGGFINVYSETGLGTTFRIYLPRVFDEGASRGDIASDQGSGHGSETVLLVEDEGAILQLEERILAKDGYCVLAANHPSQALELAAHHPGPIQLLITDIVMPMMNGKELMEKVEALRPGIKTLFMSGYTAEIIDRHGVLKSDDRFIQKPFSKKGLIDKVRAVLDS